MRCRVRFSTFHWIDLMPRVFRLPCMLLPVFCMVIKGGSFCGSRRICTVCLSIVGASFFSSPFCHGLAAPSNRRPLSTQVWTITACCRLVRRLLISWGRTLAHKRAALLILIWTSTVRFIQLPSNLIVCDDHLQKSALFLRFVVLLFDGGHRFFNDFASLFNLSRCSDDGGVVGEHGHGDSGGFCFRVESSELAVSWEFLPI